MAMALQIITILDLQMPDNNGMADNTESTTEPDSDTDGIADYLELDSDNDGCNDVVRSWLYRC